MGLTIRPMREDDVERARSIHRHAFNVPSATYERLPVPPLADGRVAEEDGSVVAMLRIHRFAHFFGGRPVPAIGIGGVAVAPEARGRRVAERMMLETLRGAREEGVAVSTLYPATVPLYRRCGYEYGGVRVRYRTALRTLPHLDGPEATPWTDDDLDQIVACYRRFAEPENGLVDRPAGWWSSRVLTSFEEGDVYRVCVREDGRVTGYAVYTQARRGPHRWQFDLDCTDLVWTTPGAAAGLLTFARRHASIAQDLLWTGPANDPLANLLPEQDAAHDSWFRPMLRLIDVPAAFEARGFPPDVATAVELAVDDDGIPANASGWRVDVAGGRAKVSPSPGARARVGARTLAAIWSGMLSARSARRLGLMEAGDTDVSTLDELFAGPTPWILDWF